MRNGLLAAVILTVLPFAASAQAVRVCTTEWPPYTTRGEAVGGLHTQVVEEAFRRLGMRAIIDVVAWERCWNELGKGGYQAIYSASYTPERGQLALYPAIPLQSLSYVAVVRRGRPSGWNGSDLAALPQPLAAPRGYSIVDYMRKAGQQVDDGAMKDSQNLEKLVNGRIGTAVIECAVAAKLIADMGLDDKLEILPVPVGPKKDYFLVIGRNAGGSAQAAADLQGRLDKVLAELAAERFIDKDHGSAR